MVWLIFAASAAVVVLAAIKLADYGDVISARTGLGGMFIGTIFMAAATSLPELLTAANAIRNGVLSLTVGDIFGSSMFNMLLIALLDLAFHNMHVLRRVAISHAMSAGLAVFMMTMAIFFIIADLDITLGWVGLDSILLIIGYLFGMWLIRNSRFSLAVESEVVDEAELAKMISLRRAVIGYLACAGILVGVTPIMVRSAIGITEVTGLTSGLVGVILVAIVTSLPEAVTTVAAVKIGAFDLAVGNLFGSNIFNMIILAMIDVFYTQGSLFAQVNPTMVLAGMIGLVMTALAGLGNLAGVERRIWIIEIDALAIILAYGLGMWFLIQRGLVQ